MLGITHGWRTRMIVTTMSHFLYQGCPFSLFECVSSRDRDHAVIRALVAPRQAPGHQVAGGP